LLCVRESQTSAERQRLASRHRTCCLRRYVPSRPLRLVPFRGSIVHPTQSLCTLRRGRHLPRRNTRYQAGATPYLGRTSTGWNAPASPGAHVTELGQISVEACLPAVLRRVEDLGKMGEPRADIATVDLGTLLDEGKKDVARLK